MSGCKNNICGEVNQPRSLITSTGTLYRSLRTPVDPLGPLVGIIDKNTALLGKWLWRYFQSISPYEHQLSAANLGRLVIFGQQLMYNRPFTAALGKELFKLCLLSSLSVNFLWVVAVLFAFGWTPGSILFLSNLGFLVSSICLFLKMALSPVSSPLL